MISCQYITFQMYCCSIISVGVENRSGSWCVGGVSRNGSSCVGGVHGQMGESFGDRGVVA